MRINAPEGADTAHTQMGRPAYEAPTREYTRKHTQTHTNTNTQRGPKREYMYIYIQPFPLATKHARSLSPIVLARYPYTGLAFASIACAVRVYPCTMAYSVRIA